MDCLAKACPEPFKACFGDKYPVELGGPCKQSGECKCLDQGTVTSAECKRACSDAMPEGCADCFLEDLQVARGRLRDATPVGCAGCVDKLVPCFDRCRAELDEVPLFKTSEAKRTVAGIARAAVAVYEREDTRTGVPAAHRLCKTATPVPAEVPKGTKHPLGGRDFDSGDAETGWHCLRFAVTEPFAYRYSYSQGGPYKGPARGEEFE